MAIVFRLLKSRIDFRGTRPSVQQTFWKGILVMASVAVSQKYEDALAIAFDRVFLAVVRIP